MGWLARVNSFKFKRSQYRQVAHRIADIIYEKMTAEKYWSAFPYLTYISDYPFIIPTMSACTASPKVTSALAVSGKKLVASNIANNGANIVFFIPKYRPVAVFRMVARTPLWKRRWDLKQECDE